MVLKLKNQKKRKDQESDGQKREEQKKDGQRDGQKNGQKRDGNLKFKKNNDSKKYDITVKLYVLNKKLLDT